MIPRPHRGTHDESGLSLVELLLSIVIMALIGSAIAMMFFVSIKVEPTARARSTFSADSAFLIRAISDDIANANTDANAVTHAAALVCTPGDHDLDVATIKLTGSAGTAYYRADIDATAATQGLSTYRVVISRQVGSGDEKTMLTGYCDHGTTFGTYVNPGFTLRLKLRVSGDADLRELVFGGTKRAQPFEPMKISGQVTNASGFGLAHWQVTVWSTTNSAIRTLYTDTSGNYSTYVIPGTYRVCQQAMVTGWTTTKPIASTPNAYVDGGGSALTCPSAAGNVTSPIGYSVSATTANLDFVNGYSNGGFNCNDAALNQTLNNATDPWWPSYRGPDYVVRTYAPFLESIQTAVDLSETEGPSKGDINQDGVVIIGVLSGSAGGGKATQTVTIDGDYAGNNKRFALVGCGGGVRSLTSTPAISVTSGATALDTNLPNSAYNGNIVLLNIYGTESLAGVPAVKVDGTGRLLRTVSARQNTGPGIQINGDENIVYQGEADGNGGNGLTITGHRNTVAQAFTAINSTSGGDGIKATGDDNSFDAIRLGPTGGNAGDGLDVTGARTTVNGVKSVKNGGAGFRISGVNTTITNSDAGESNGGNGASGFDLNGNGVNIDASHAYKNGGAGYKIVGSSARITNSDAGKNNDGNGAGGFDINGSNNWLTNVKAYENAGVGIRIWGGTGGNTVDNSDAGEDDMPNTSHGFDISGSGNTLTSLTAEGNGGVGILLTGSGSTIKTATVNLNADGVRVVGGGNTIESVKSEANREDGFDISGGSTSALANILQSNTSNSGNAGSSKENTLLEFRLSGWIWNKGSNKADSAVVPGATKCPSTPAPGRFPASSATTPVNVTGASPNGLCE